MTAASGPAEKPYGKCEDCDLDFADRDAVTTHTSDTLAPTADLGITARSHRVSIVNPTEDERRASRVRWAIEDAVNSAYEDLYDRVGRGEFTADEVAAEMWAFDLRDGWDGYVAEDAD